MLTVGTDSYITVDQADAYISSHVINNDAWLELPPASKEIHLRNACIAIDNLKLKGAKRSNQQCLQFPRGITTAVPKEILIAQALEAFAYTKKQNVQRAELQEQGVTAVKLGNASESYDTTKRHYVALQSSLAKHLMSRYLAGSVPLV